MFEHLFHNMIAELLHNCPENHVSENGTPFWTAPKRCPQIIRFDKNDPIHQDFIFATANLFAYTFGLPKIEDKAKTAQLAADSMISEFKPQKKEIKTNPNDPTIEKNDDDEVVIENITATLAAKKVDATNRMRTTEFEKDDDTNYHIDFISAVANLRARNYKIDEVERSKVKVIAGKIIPAIATTTAMVVGAVGFEIIKYIMGKDISKHRNLFSNLGLPLWLFSETLPPIKNKDEDYNVIALGPIRAVPPAWTNWDSIKIQGPKTVEQVIKELEEKHGLVTNAISLRDKPIFRSYSKDPELKKLAALTPEVCWREVFGEELPKHKKYIELVFDCCDKDGIDCLIPKVIYLKH
jgi:ubiquitin-activating enzyme E1